MKEIKLEYIARIQACQMKIFECKDDDCADLRCVRANERAIQNYLNKITPNEDEQRLIEDTIEKFNFYSKDPTFKPIVEEFKKLGYTIIYKELMK